jgi:hypothetical protein
MPVDHRISVGAVVRDPAEEHRAVAIVALGAVAPPAYAVAGSAAVVVVLVSLMILAQFRQQMESNQP